MFRRRDRAYGRIHAAAAVLRARRLYHSPLRGHGNIYLADADRIVPVLRQVTGGDSVGTGEDRELSGVLAAMARAALFRMRLRSDGRAGMSDERLTTPNRR